MKQRIQCPWQEATPYQLTFEDNADTPAITETRSLVPEEINEASTSPFAQHYSLMETAYIRTQNQYKTRVK